LLSLSLSLSLSLLLLLLVLFLRRLNGGYFAKVLRELVAYRGELDVLV
jgi:hypothetical protein